MNNQAEAFKSSDKKKKVSIEDKKADRCWRRWRSGQCPFAPWWSSSASLDGWGWGCQSRNIISRGRQQTNWLTKTISSSGNPSFNSPCAETLISEFTSNAFSEGQVHHLYLIYLSWCKYCWSFTVDLVRPHFSEVHPRIKLLSTAEIWGWSGGMQITDTFVQSYGQKNKVTFNVFFFLFLFCLKLFLICSSLFVVIIVSYT